MGKKVSFLKHLKQFAIILAVSFLGELLNFLIPLPIPASIYVIVLMFLFLETGLIPVQAVKETSDFLIQIMPLMFIPAAVGLLNSWSLIRPAWLQYVAITVISTVAVMAVSGKVTQAVLRAGKRKEAHHD